MHGHDLFERRGGTLPYLTLRLRVLVLIEGTHFKDHHVQGAILLGIWTFSESKNRQLQVICGDNNNNNNNNNNKSDSENRFYLLFNLLFKNI